MTPNPNPRLGQPVKNKHKVQKHQWAKWSNLAKRVFNDMYYSLRPNMQFAYLHPDATAAPREHWATTRWNVAWMAASAVNNDKTARLDGTIENGKIHKAAPRKKRARRHK